jgi:hypothetical protein
VTSEVLGSSLDHAIAAADEARRKCRDRFQALYGAFAKCDRCGKYGSLFRVHAPCATAPYGPPQLCTGTFRAAGYAPPPPSSSR